MSKLFLKTSKKVNLALRKLLHKQGTASFANDGYEIAGKTGTAQSQL